MSKFIKMVDKLRYFPVINQGKGLIQPVNARDLGKALYHVLISENIKNGDYILSGEKPITMLQAFKLISMNLGKKTTFISFPIEFGVFLARCMKVFTIGRVDYVEKVQRMGEDRSFPHDAATGDFGYSPSPFDKGIKKEVEQYLNKKVNKNKENSV
ncbi:nucleoside-diphosphate sugar epimerase [Bacillus coahuilensis]|uniref:nucleoside-diphosphate sugar epimerase n=1 Tax=Bacillus coahuilensis TaxID=408580 RepID=UPI00192A91AA|nr:nucleoside-diphosphate sugar epimerase [Bacillus coahuilensis]